jgi:hypothetical protein
MKSQGVKMVSPLTNNPVDNIESLISVDRNPNKDDLILENEDFLPMYCFLCHRNLFDHVRIVEHPYASIEAKDFANKMKSKGFSQAVCGKSWVHHEGRATLKLMDKNSKIQKILRKIRSDFESSN